MPEETAEELAQVISPEPRRIILPQGDPLANVTVVSIESAGTTSNTAEAAAADVTKAKEGPSTTIVIQD